MYRHIKTFVNGLALQFNTGNFRRMAENYVFPLPLQMHGDMVVMHTSAALAESMRRHHARSAAEGLTPAIPRIVAVDLPRNGRFRIWVDWRFAKDADQDAPCTQTLYFCSTVGNRIQIEMVQYMRLAGKNASMRSVFDQRRIA
jgi:hypothetical protein